MRLRQARSQANVLKGQQLSFEVGGGELFYRVAEHALGGRKGLTLNFMFLKTTDVKIFHQTRARGMSHHLPSAHF